LADQATTISPSSSPVSMPLPEIASRRSRTEPSSAGATPSAGLAAVSTPSLFSFSLSSSPIGRKAIEAPEAPASAPAQRCEMPSMIR
jgi:hypothetical protein